MLHGRQIGASITTNLASDSGPDRSANMKPTLLLAALLSLAACGQSGEPDIQLGNAWARPTRGDAPGAVYVAINNKGEADDRLIGAFTDHAAMAMVHQ